MRQRTFFASICALVTVVLLTAAACTTTTMQPGATTGALAQGSAPSDPPGWTRFTSPWLGYSIALPPTFGFDSHVDGDEYQRPYDMFFGSVPDSGRTMMLAVSPSELAEGETPPPVRADVLAGDIAFEIGEPEGEDQAGTTLFAAGYSGTTRWTFIADTSNDKSTKAFFRQVVATFRPPPPGFVEPTPTPSVAASRPPVPQPQPMIAQIAVGAAHACALTGGGGVMCWGDNSHGQLGDGTRSSRTVPVDVSHLAGGIAAIDAGGDVSCALTKGGGVKCWGYNYHGELGNGNATDSAVPVDVSGLAKGVSAIAVGGFHVCALTSGGGVKCWGDNTFGQLGIGTQEGSSVPVDVSGLTSGVTAIAALYHGTCALTSDGGVKCWGDNTFGQLGGSPLSLVPVDITGLAHGVAAISGGGDNACALMSAGAVKCWGANEHGQLGDGTTTDSGVPVEVLGLPMAVRVIAVSAYHACVLTDGGRVMCWGGNQYGQLGNGTTTDSGVPVEVLGLPRGATAVSAGPNSTCASLAAGGAKCWGNNAYGQLGDGTTERSGTPVDVTFDALSMPPTHAAVP